MSLREELQRIADTAPVADVPRDTFARARRARRRGRLAVVATVAAAVVVVAVVAGLMTGLPQRSAPPVASGDDPGVPARLWDVPERMSARDEHSWTREEVTTDLAVGRAAVAFESWSLPVVVGASDGAYHLLDLPGWTGPQVFLRGQRHGLALSPDGRRLAYAWAGRATATAPVPSGVRVVDLETGDVRTIRIPGGEGVVVDTIGWSPDSRWLVWRGERKDSWTASSMGGSTIVAGRIAPGATVSEDLPPGGQDDAVALAVAATGEVSVLSRDRLLRWDDGVVVRRRLSLPQGLEPRGAASPDGSAVALGRWVAGRRATSFDLAAGGLVTRRLPSDVYPAGAQVRPLGWIDDDLVVSEVRPAAGPDEPAPDGQVVVATRTGSETSTYRIVAHVPQIVGDTLSVAVDLMTLERPTVDRPEPDWPWSEERLSLAIGLGVAGALSVLYGLRHLWRRRPRVWRQEPPAR